MSKVLEELTESIEIEEGLVVSVTPTANGEVILCAEDSADLFDSCFHIITMNLGQAADLGAMLNRAVATAKAELEG